jgi:hypothetical protein
MIGARSTSGEKKNAYKIFVGKPKRKRSMGRPIYRRFDNIKVDLERQYEMISTGLMWLR